MDKLIKIMTELKDEEVWNLYGLVIKTLKSRNLIRTRNMVGERGEFLAINTYNNTPGLPNLQAAPEGTQNVDALSRKGERYSIKTITSPGKTTSVFYGVGEKNDPPPKNKKFEYVIIVVIEPNFNLKEIYEISWEKFLLCKRWHSTMRGWNLSLTKDLIANSNRIYPVAK